MWRKIIVDNLETNYSVSDCGEVKNDNTNKLLSLQTQQGYKHVTLSINNKSRRFRVHRLVAFAYIPNPNNKPYINHIDGCRSNNKVENLEWVTPSENTQHAVNTGLMTPTRTKIVVQYSLNGEKIQEYYSISDAARATNSLPEKIVMCCQLLRRQHNGFQWRYGDDNIEQLSQIEKAPNTSKRVAQLDKNTGEIIAIYNSMGEAAKAVNGTQSAISHVIKGDKQTKTHKGYGWKLVDEIVQ